MIKGIKGDCRVLRNIISLTRNERVYSAEYSWSLIIHERKSFLAQYLRPPEVFTDAITTNPGKMHKLTIGKDVLAMGSTQIAEQAATKHVDSAFCYKIDTLTTTWRSIYHMLLARSLLRYLQTRRYVRRKGMVSSKSESSTSHRRTSATATVFASEYEDPDKAGSLSCHGCSPALSFIGHSRP